MLTNKVNVVRYLVSGNTYSIPFPYWVASDIKAFITKADESVTELVQGTDFTVSTPDAVSGTLTKVSDWGTATRLTIYREVDLTQLIDLINGEKIDGEELEKALDLKVAALQQLQEQFTRTVKTSVDEQGSDIQIPNKATRAGMLLGFDNTGEKVALRSLAQFDIDVAATAANAAASEASKNKAQEWAEKAEDSEVEPGSYSAKHWASKASQRAGAAAISANNADQSAKDSEAYAVGTRGGEAVAPTDPAYHYNAKYFADLIAQIISGAMRYQGVWNMTGETDYSAISTPRLKGDMFYCQGSAVTIDGVTYTQGDLIIFNSDVADGATITTAVIDKIDNSETITPDNTAELENKTIDSKKNTIKDSPTFISEDTTLAPTKQLNVIIDTASVTLTLGAGPYQGYELKVKAWQNCSVTDGTYIKDALAEGESVTYIWNGTRWFNPAAIFCDHNIMRRNPKDITAYFTDGTLWKRLHGTDGFELFEDLFVGDYFDMGTTVRATGSTTNQGTSWITIAGINTMMKRGYNSGDITGDYVNYNHLVMVPGKGRLALCFGDGQMYAAIPFTGGYTGSKMKTTLLTNIDTQLTSIFSTHLKATWEWLSSANNSTSYGRLGGGSGASTAATWTQVKSLLMSEVEAFGSIAWSSSGYDTGTQNTQLPLFQQCPEALWDRDTQTTWWLKDVVSGSLFASVGWYGYSSRPTATDGNGVRPRFVLS